MSANPVPLPAQAPLAADRLARLQAAVGDLDPAALNWASGYLAALAAERGRGAGAAGASAAAIRATVLYASQTGNGRRVAEKLGRSLAAAGLPATVVSAADYPTRLLAQERLLYLVASTHGDGDPPDDARTLVDFLNSRRAPRLESLAFSVLALGDSSYPQFCATGRAFDERLEALGARRVGGRVDCDVDYEGHAGTWIDGAVELARQELGSDATASANVFVLPSAAPVAELASREAPLEVELATNQRITARGAERDVRHIELALPARQFEYEPGDAIGVVLPNPSALVDEILSNVRLDAKSPASAGRCSTGSSSAARAASLPRCCVPRIQPRCGRS